MRNQLAIFTVLAVVCSVAAAPQVTVHHNQDNDVAIDISREVYVAPEEKVGDISDDVPANILTNRQRRDSEDDDEEDFFAHEDADLVGALDLDSFEEEDPHLSASAPALPLSPEEPAADLPVDDEEIETAHAVSPEGYEYKTVPAEYIPPSNEKIESAHAVTPDGYEYKKAPTEYIPPSDEKVEPGHVLTPDGYEYKTVRRVRYRYRNRY